MILRQARVADAPAVAAIANEVVRDPVITFTTVERGAAEVAAQIAARGAAFIVAEAMGAVLGFATHGAFRPGPGYARTCEHSIALAPAARGQGTGRALLAAMMAQARAAGLAQMVGAVSAANPGGIAFHAALGFAEVGRLPGVGNKHGRWLDLVLMQKDLAIPPASDGSGQLPR